MRKASPLAPVRIARRTTSEVRRWMKHRADWMASLQPEHHFHELFDHIPGVYFFAKDRDGVLMFASRGLLRRYEMRDESEFIGRTDHEINPGSMADCYVRDDRRLLEGSANRIERIELWWEGHGIPDWFVVTKLPLRDRRGRIAGVMGILRQPQDAERRLPVFQTVARAVEIIRRDFAKPLIIAEVARECGESLRQLQRRFQTAFGITPQEFLMMTRVLAATRLLEEANLSAAEIATRCGFVDASSFARHFKQRTGTTPTAYRLTRAAASM